MSWANFSSQVPSENENRVPCLYPQRGSRFCVNLFFFKYSLLAFGLLMRTRRAILQLEWIHLGIRVCLLYNLMSIYRGDSFHLEPCDKPNMTTWEGKGEGLELVSHGTDIRRGWVASVGAAPNAGS